MEEMTLYRNIYFRRYVNSKPVICTWIDFRIPEKQPYLHCSQKYRRNFKFGDIILFVFVCMMEIVFDSENCRVLVLKPLCPEIASFETAVQKCRLFVLYLSPEAVIYC